MTEDPVADAGPRPGPRFRVRQTADGDQQRPAASDKAARRTGPAASRWPPKWTGCASRSTTPANDDDPASIEHTGTADPARAAGVMAGTGRPGRVGAG